MKQNVSNYRHFAIIDLGSAAIRFELFRLIENSNPPQLKLIEKNRTLLRLGQLENGKLTERKIRDLLVTIREISRVLLKYENIEVGFVATEVLRKASNREEVIDLCHQLIDQRIQVISPEEEARLTIEGILCFEPFPYPQLYFLDIGGRSSEISLVDRGVIKWSVSIPNGALIEGNLDHKSVPPIYIPRHTQELISQIKIESQSIPLIGSGGTFRSFDKIIPKLGIASGDNVGMYMEAFCLLENVSHQEFTELTKEQAERRDLLPQGLGILREILFLTNPSEIIVTRFSLRHGLLKKLILPYYPEIAEKGFREWKVELN